MINYQIFYNSKISPLFDITGKKIAFIQNNHCVFTDLFCHFFGFYEDGFYFPFNTCCHSGIYMEWLSLLNTSRAQKILGIVALILIFVAVINERVSQNLLLALLFVSFLFWFLVSPVVVLNKYRVSKGMSVIVAFIMCLASMLALYYAFIEGLMFLLSTLALVWIIDTGAYFTGKIFGYRKLFQRLAQIKLGKVFMALSLCIRYTVYLWLKLMERGKNLLCIILEHGG